VSLKVVKRVIVRLLENSTVEVIGFESLTTEEARAVFDEIKKLWELSEVSEETPHQF
jgi:hypothetical protein